MRHRLTMRAVNPTFTRRLLNAALRQARHEQEQRLAAAPLPDIADDDAFQEALSYLCLAVSQAVEYKKEGRNPFIVGMTRPLDAQTNKEWENINRLAQAFALRCVRQQRPPR